jgi:glycosidase
LKCKLSWHYESDAQRSQLLNYYKKLIAFRKTHPAMQGRDRDAITVFHQPSENKIIGFTRQHNEQQVLVVLNFDRQAACFSYPLEKNAKKIFDSSHPAGMGPGAKNNDAIKAGEKITMPAESALIYEL